MGDTSLDGGCSLLKRRPLAHSHKKQRKEGFKGNLFLPKENAREAAIVDNLEVTRIDKH